MTLTMSSKALASAAFFWSWSLRSVLFWPQLEFAFACEKVSSIKISNDFLVFHGNGAKVWFSDLNLHLKWRQIVCFGFGAAKSSLFRYFPANIPFDFACIFLFQFVFLCTERTSNKVLYSLLFIECCSFGSTMAKNAVLLKSMRIDQFILH